MAEDKDRPDQTQGEIVIYQAEDGLTKVECRFVDDTVWLTQQQMAELFHTSRSNIVEHIGHIYEEGELDEWMRFQPVGNSDRFEWRATGK